MGGRGGVPNIVHPASFDNVQWRIYKKNFFNFTGFREDPGKI